MSAAERRIGVIGYDDVQGLDVVGPIDAFTTANALYGTSPYDVVVVSPSGRSFRSESGLRFVPGVSIKRAPLFDTAIVPGGSGIRVHAALRARLAAWLMEIAPRTRRIATVCTGVYALAETGLLDGRRATTHWRYAADVALRYPAVRLEPDAIFIKSDRFYSSAGVTAGIDLTLALIEEDLGRETALAVARELVMYVRRAGGQMQYSPPLRAQTEATGDLERVVGWMLEHLHEDLTVEAIAERMERSGRHVTRRFLAAFGETPASFVERLRLDRARTSLTDSRDPIADIAVALGYRSADAFGRAFERRYGVAPTTFRRRFASAADKHEPR